MALPEIEFELSTYQYEQMGYPGIKQGEPLSVVLDAGVLLPDVAAESWFTVRPEALPAQFVRTGPATYAFAGQIAEAELVIEDDEQTAVLLVDCGVVKLRVTCAPQGDNRLPYGTWETRYLTGVGRVQGLVEDEFKTAIGHATSVTVWGFRRLSLMPGDPLFGQWHDSADLLPLPLHYDRIIVVARVHRDRI
ncbi:MAG: hypothetical protein IAE81_01935 [Caldilineaceae bacterium]|jgi:hypothetical protein|nr:hypothetical protein [Caldilineaceae bacterium]